MDPISQFAVGAVFAGAFDQRLRRAVVDHQLHVPPSISATIMCAGIAAMAPDLDVLIRSADYPLLALKFHRHFTHALFMAPFMAAVLMLPLWLIFKRYGMDKLQVFILALLGVATHGVLDAMTNYGTHLAWPFSNERMSWNIISIVDPIFTLTLLGALIAASIKHSRRILVYAFMFMLVYWGLGVHQHHQAEKAMLDLASTRNHTVARHQVKPSFGNIILWRAQYEAEGQIYTDAINVVPFLEPKIYEGTHTSLLLNDESWLATLPPNAAQDVRDFTFFSDGWVSPVRGPDGTIESIGDMRFAALPNAPGPMWALQLSQLSANGHAQFVQLPRSREGDWGRLWDMVVRR